MWGKARLGNQRTGEEERKCTCSNEGNEVEMEIMVQDLERKFRRLAGMLGRGEVAPLEKTLYDMGEIHQALRQFTQGKHIGKLVVNVPPKAPLLDTPGKSSTHRDIAYRCGSTMGLLDGKFKMSRQLLHCALVWYSMLKI